MLKSIVGQKGPKSSLLKTGSLIAMTALSSMGLTYAQEDEAPTELDTIVVTGTRLQNQNIIEAKRNAAGILELAVSG